MEFLLTLLRGLLGIVFLLAVAYVLSNNRRAINWRLVCSGLALQVVFAIGVLKVPIVNKIFDAIAGFFVVILDFTKSGSAFIFGDLITRTDSFGYIFAFQVLPTVVFFSALSSVLYYFGILQRIIYGISWVMSRTMGLSGPESLASAANVFIGQTEAPLAIKPYLEHMTRSELLCLMTGGMATIAGGVFAAYVGFLGGDDPVQQLYFARHLLTASIMSAPAAIVAAKMLFPETEREHTEEEVKIEVDSGSNLLDAIANGTTDGLRLAVNVGAMLLVFTALIAMVNYVMVEFIGGWSGLNDWAVAVTGGRAEGFTFTFLLGLIFAPIAWLLGVPVADIFTVGELLGQKTVINEFVAYGALGDMQKAGLVLQPKSLIIAIYALCGFSNFASIGIQIGGISAIAPGQRRALTELGIKSLVGGTIACFLTATLAGVIT
ncbi:MAG: Na+ dependent nucleoside transporter [Saprospiraceae bacterium]|nr:Na+ dependent nucleoside transporter [Saprospiraceae bacterium]